MFILLVNAIKSFPFHFLFRFQKIKNKRMTFNGIVYSILAFGCGQQIVDVNVLVYFSGGFY